MILVQRSSCSGWFEVGILPSWEEVEKFLQETARRRKEIVVRQGERLRNRGLNDYVRLYHIVIPEWEEFEQGTDESIGQQWKCTRQEMRTADQLLEWEDRFFTKQP